jgi:hypothetical protein
MMQKTININGKYVYNILGLGWEPIENILRRNVEYCNKMQTGE